MLQIAIRNELNIHVSRACFNNLIGATYESITKVNVNGFVIIFLKATKEIACFIWKLM